MAKTATLAKPARQASSTKQADSAQAKATLAISSKNYSSWSLRGWLLCKMAGLDFEEQVMPSDDPSTRAELLLLSPSFLVPKLTHEGVSVWDTLAIGEYLNEIRPEAGLLPADRAARAHCRAICGEMHSGFANLRSALAMNLKARHPGFKVWAGAQADIDRVTTIWRDCLTRYGGPYLFGAAPTMADAMYAPVCTRFVTYDVKLDGACAEYCKRIMALPHMQEWIKAALAEPDEVEELDVEF
jgi:glutathione S-transferase